MKAELKHLHSPDVKDLRTFKAGDPTNFSLFVQAMVGPEGEDESESFDFTVCTPRWLAETTQSQGPVIGLHHIVVAAFDYEALIKAVQTYCSGCEGSNWQVVGAKVGRLGCWEFDNYDE